MSAAPQNKVSFQLKFSSDDVSEVFAVVPPNISIDHAGTHKLGELFWNGNEWLFVRWTPDGDMVMDGLHYIPTDPEGEEAHRQEDREIALKPEALRDPLRQELNGRRKIRRDETRDMAVVGAKIEARKWWGTDGGFLDQRKGCTGCITSEHGLQHDGDTCPIHEADESEAQVTHSFPADCPQCGTAGFARESGVCPACGFDGR